MKQLMIGNEALARGAYEAGCLVISSYPGTPSTEITEFAANYSEIDCEWAPNEKVAMEVAFGASLAGKRSACAMKHVGLNVAADPLFTLSYTGVNGGMVVFVADDPGMHSSQNEQDSRHYAIAAKLPMLEPSDSSEALQFTKAAFELSERFDSVFLVRTVMRVAHTQGPVKISERQCPKAVNYEKKPQKYIMMPGYAKLRHPVVEDRTASLTKFAETTELNREEYAESKIGIITSGSSYRYVKEIFGDSVNILKLGLINPLPVERIKNFAAKVSELYVIEELDGIIEAHCRALGIKVSHGKDIFSPIGEFSQATIAKSLGLPEKAHVSLDTSIPVRPPVMCPGCPHRGIYYVLAKNKIKVLGDIGCYTLGAQKPLNALDSTLCMGASVSGIHGFNKADRSNEKKTVAVIGDSTFMHSGVTGLINISYNATASTVIILDNSITGMTGHQQNPTTGYNLKGDPATKIDLEALCRAVGIERVRVVDPYDLAECEKAVLEELEINAPSVIISRRPCALLKYVKAKPSLKISTDKCRSCRACMKIGCPAISFKGNKACIDSTLCVGCGVCKQLCKFDAITNEQ